MTGGGDEEEKDESLAELLGPPPPVVVDETIEDSGFFKPEEMTGWVEMTLSWVGCCC